MYVNSIELLIFPSANDIFFTLWLPPPTQTVDCVSSVCDFPAAPLFYSI